MIQEIEFTASDRARAILAAMGRTEDLAFSPGNRRLAIAEIFRNRVAIFDIDISTSDNGVRINLSGAGELSSPALRLPHGLDFVDENTLAVANRAGSVAFLEVPPDGADGTCREVLPAYTGSDTGRPLMAPGSVSVTRVDDRRCEILICDSTSHRIIRRSLDWRTGGATGHTDVLLQRYLHIPDGIAVSPDRQWIAISNHRVHHVAVFRNSRSLNKDSEPDGLLRYVSYPHGLAFTADGRHLIVADAGMPCIHVYERGEGGWCGVHPPLATLQVMDEATFQRGRHSPEEGGPKGLAIDADSNVVAVTSHCQPLAFLDLRTLLSASVSSRTQDDRRTHAIRCELSLMEQSTRLAAALEEAELELHRLRRPRLVRVAAALKRRVLTRLRRSRADTPHVR